MKPETASLAPFLLEPLYVERIWGTVDLRPWYDYMTKPAAGHDPIGEVWLTGDKCRVATGACKGSTLEEVFARHACEMLGEAGAKKMDGQSPLLASPLLIKVIFAREKLSVQVHPDDTLARKYGEPRGKTECWYALAAEPGAKVATGLRAGVTLEQVEQEVADGTLEESLEILPVTAGDLIFVDAGTVHAIWPGSVLLETQQNSDLTYRLFDYGRPRELHVAKALEATRLRTRAGKIAPVKLADRTVLVESEYFRVEKMAPAARRAGAEFAAADEDAGLMYLFAGAGAGRVEASGNSEATAFDGFELKTGEIAAVPASAGGWQVEDMGGLELIRIVPRFPGAAGQGA